ncbi:MAG: 3-phosphoglycerate dehydrogenase [Clostridia bacterium]|nr:3-phosphoglycerate dehydrogenase [Clostridia bacterium]
MKSILKLNSISPLADKYFENYDYTDSCANPDGIMLRSFKMHDYEIGSNLVAVARAGAGVNNIPLDKMSEKGVCVFNTPGANANAVKELVVCALLLGSRKIYEGITWAQNLSKDDDVAKLVEKGKSQFVGGELYGKTLGVLGLGAIGAKVANVAIDLGMDVLGYDPYISVDAAWRLSRKVKHEKELMSLFAGSDYISIHMPLTPDTKGIINKDTIAQMKDGVCIINCARGELVNNDDLKTALLNGKVSRYVTDFPVADLLGVEGVITIPHLGASTPEAEDNCAIMAGRQLTDYIENGNVVNSVNFPNLKGPDGYVHRVSIVHKNVPYMINYATKPFSDAHINIDNLLSAGRGDVGYMILDTEKEVPQSVIDELEKVDGFLKVRVIK